MIEVIILNNDIVYSTEVESEKRLLEITDLWYDLVNKKCIVFNDVYRRIFREVFGVTVDCDMTEEMETVRERYGPRPIESEEFRGKLNEVNDLYDSAVESFPVFGEFATEYGLVLTEKVYVLDLYG